MEPTINSTFIDAKIKFQYAPCYGHAKKELKYVRKEGNFSVLM